MLYLLLFFPLVFQVVLLFSFPYLASFLLVFEVLLRVPSLSACLLGRVVVEVVFNELSLLLLEVVQSVLLPFAVALSLALPP